MCTEGSLLMAQDQRVERRKGDGGSGEGLGGEGYEVMMTGGVVERRWVVRLRCAGRKVVREVGVLVGL